jgi:SNF family Na+-dependent transporter
MVTAVVFQAFAVSNSVLLLAGVVVFFSSSFLQDDTVKNANAAIISAIFFIVFLFWVIKYKNSIKFKNNGANKNLSYIFNLKPKNILIV